MTDDQLTDKQRQVLNLHREGKNPTEIGKALGTTSQAVHGHFRRLREMGVLPPEPSRGSRRGSPKPAAASVDPADAVTAALEGIRQQRATLNARLVAIGHEKEALGAEEDAIHESLQQLHKMEDAAAPPAETAHKPAAAKAKAKPAAAKPEPTPAAT